MLTDILKVFHSKFVAATSKEARKAWLEAAFVVFDAQPADKIVSIGLPAKILSQLCLIDVDEFPDHVKFKDGVCVDCHMSEEEAEGQPCLIMVGWVGTEKYTFENWKETVDYASRVGWDNIGEFEPTRSGFKLWKLDMAREKKQAGSQKIKWFGEDPGDVA